MKEVKISSVPKIHGKNFSNASQFELEIETQRILYVLQVTMKKLQLLSFLPSFAENNFKELEEFFQPNEIKYIRDVCNKYSRERTSSTSCRSKSPTTSNIVMEGQYSGISNIAHPNLFPNEHKKCPSCIAKMVQMYLNNEPFIKWLESMELPTSKIIMVNLLIQGLEELKKLIYDLLLTTSTQDSQITKELKLVYKSNYVLKEAIKRAEALKHRQKEAMNKDLQALKQQLQDRLSTLNNLQTEFNEEMLRESKQSEKEMTAATVASELNQSEMTHEANESDVLYKKNLREHIISENNQRNTRIKVETQLASWLNKYDNDIGERFSELETLKKQYEVEKAEFDEMEEVFMEQNVLYVKLMAEKDEEEQRIYEEMAYEFLKNRSARRIIRWWKGVLQRRAERRKKRAQQAKAKKGGAKGAKKPGGGGGGGKGKGKGKKEKGDKKKDKKVAKEEAVAKKEVTKVTAGRAADPNAYFGGKKINQELFEELQSPENPLVQQDIKVDLSEL